MTYALDRCQVRMKKCADQYVFILDMYDLGYVNFDLKLISALSPIIQVSSLKHLIQKFINLSIAKLRRHSVFNGPY